MKKVFAISLFYTVFFFACIGFFEVQHILTWYLFIRDRIAQRTPEVLNKTYSLDTVFHGSVLNIWFSVAVTATLGSIFLYQLNKSYNRSKSRLKEQLYDFMVERNKLGIKDFTVSVSNEGKHMDVRGNNDDENFVIDLSERKAAKD